MNYRTFFSLTVFGLIFSSACDTPKPMPASDGTTVVRQPLNKDQTESAAAIVEESKQTKAKPATKNPAAKDKVSLLLNWYPEAEHGGFYAAQVHGIYESFGLDVEIRPGGKTIVVAQELVLGRVQF